MKFFDRKKEIETLLEIDEKSNTNAQFTVITGRRRIGKTALILNAYKDRTFIYLFVSKKAEPELCADYTSEVEKKLGIKIPGKISKFYQLFEFLIELSKNQHIIIFIDEFQEFLNINPSVYSDMQKLWDINHTEAKLNLIVCGSVNSLINKIFRDNKEPLYARQTQFMHIECFTTDVLKQILEEYSPSYPAEDLLALYTFTGGVPKYVELIIDNKAFTKAKMINLIFCRESVFITEGKNLLIEEFGKDYGIYFTILSKISTGVNSRTAIEAEINREIGGYITKLENDYGIIEKRLPLLAKSQTKSVRYYIKDNFLNFWFRFVFKYNYMLEINAHDKLKQIVERDYDIFSGFMLEKYFRQKLTEQQTFTRIGSWWDRKGENEIDIIASDEISSKTTYYEVKRQKARINIEVLRAKSEMFKQATGGFKGHQEDFVALGMEDM